MDVIAYLKECRRVLYVASRPRKKEFEQIVKTTCLGIALVGLIGVVLAILLNLV